MYGMSVIYTISLRLTMTLSKERWENHFGFGKGKRAKVLWGLSRALCLLGAMNGKKQKDL